MGLFDFISGQFIEVIEWTDSSDNTLVYRFPVKDQEIKMGAQLTVRESQIAVFVNEGRVADVFEPGRHTLSTQNMPIFTKLKSWKFGFDSPFKAEVYFVNTRVFTDQKWGTSNPITKRDTDFGIVRIRAFGNYSYKVKNPEKFLREIVGTDGHFTLDEIGGQLKSNVVSSFTQLVGSSSVAVLDLAGHQDNIAKQLKTKLLTDFEEYGLEVTKLVIENVSLPKEVEKAIDKRASMGAVGNIGQYAQFEMAQAMGKGGAGSDMANMAAQMGVGMAMGNQMQQSITNPAPAAAAPPPLPGQSKFHYADGPNQVGELSPADIAQRLRANPEGNHLVWKQGMAAWTNPSQVPEIQSALQAIPPAIPGGPPPLPNS